jgi:nitrite reductase/ring-hydroxylating ferredoxin subunit
MTPQRPMSKACDTCPLLERRMFLRDAAIVAASIVATLAAAPGGGARAVRLGFRRALRSAGDEHTYPLPTEDGATIDRDTEIILVRYAGRVYGFNLSCPHQHTALRWQPEDGQFQSPRHHSRYRPDGVFVSGRATRGMDRFGVRRDGGTIVVNVAQYYRQDENAAEWDAAFVVV